MRPDDRGTHIASNGFAGISNGSTTKKVTLSNSINGHSPSQPASNGMGPSQSNGSVKSPSPVRSPTYHGHNREEVTRILIQGLYDMGYSDAATSLSRESHYELESPSVAAFRQAIMDGQWTDAEAILLGSYHGVDGKASAMSNFVVDGPAGLVLAEEFSHDGTKLATASKDRTVIIYETETFTILHRFTDHEERVTYVTWSPDDSKLISCSMDNKARVWEVSSGTCLVTVDHETPVSSASWAPDGLSFVTSALEKNSSICQWSLRSSDFRTSLNSCGGFRAQDCAISPDGQRLVVIDSEKHLHVFNFHTFEKEYSQAFPAKLTCVSVTKDSKNMLVNLSNGEIQLLEVETGVLIRTFEGQAQDSMIYVWHKENGILIEKLKGHASCVNAIAWNPCDPGMFASAGDDRRVRIWSNSVPPSEAVPSSDRRPISSNSYTRMSAIRSTFMGGSNL
ncbi:hypothetical protein EPUS_06751 [Endocarpon pusillum Z07020]|uniref:Protein fyv10 n=1 Tax=Endocarpon pusillum (strain Z07020 / HMAS-L-300199) TaxID=1263415 RepID=U1GGQ8_ENDPU|nr:uncharacterized protein EPUS_06751 [Endocarpon pusillum Z07020]ERF70966.1 hypothetical protein EPUS_06751 [Endocarpon pusillum Z07020]